VINRYLSRILLSIVFSLAVVAYAFAQSSFDRPRVYDVLNYTIRVGFDAPKKIVDGDTTVTLTPLAAPLTSVDLDAINLKFTSVRVDGESKELQYKAGSGTIKVELGRTLGPGERIALRFRYTIANPVKGVVFIAASSGTDPSKHPAQIWTQNEPEDARYWFPSFDYPNDKATTEEFITVPKSEIAVGNGSLIDSPHGPNGTVTYHYKMDQPYSTYLMSFVVGDYARLEDKHGSVPLSFYAYRDRQRVAGIAFSRTKDMMAAYESLTGIPFAFPK